MTNFVAYLLIFEQCLSDVFYTTIRRHSNRKKLNAAYKEKSYVTIYRASYAWIAQAWLILWPEPAFVNFSAFIYWSIYALYNHIHFTYVKMVTSIESTYYRRPFLLERYTRYVILLLRLWNFLMKNINIRFSFRVSIRRGQINCIIIYVLQVLSFEIVLMMFSLIDNLWGTFLFGFMSHITPACSHRLRVEPRVKRSKPWDFSLSLKKHDRRFLVEENSSCQLYYFTSINKTSYICADILLEICITPASQDACHAYRHDQTCVYDFTLVLNLQSSEIKTL